MEDLRTFQSAHLYLCLSSLLSLLRHLYHGCEDVTVLSLLQTLQRALQEQAVPAPSRWAPPPVYSNCMRKSNAEQTAWLSICHPYSACGGDEATSVLYDILGQWQRRNRKHQSGFPDLFLHQGPAFFQTPAGQQHQCSGCHLLRKTQGFIGLEWTQFSIAGLCLEPASRANTFWRHL